MRLFLAVPISIEAKRLILDSLREEVEKINAKWVSRENLHITLKFLGEVNKERMSEIEKRMTDVATRHSEHKFEITDLGAFPSIKLIRVLFYNIKPFEPFIDLSKDIDESLIEANFAREENFTPHITIARFKVHLKNLTLLDFNKSIKFSEKMDRFNLMESKLYSTGPVYSVVREFKLKGVLKENG